MANQPPHKQDMWTAEQFIEAIRGSGGIISVIAQRIGCSWYTAQKYIKQYATVARAFQDEKERTSDLAVSVLLQAIQAGDLGTAKWWLERQRKMEWAERREITGADGGPIETKDVSDVISKLLPEPPQE